MCQLGDVIYDVVILFSKMAFGDNYGNDSGDDDNNNNNNDKDNNDPVGSVLVIGAGFAGLVVANRLLLSSSQTHWVVTVVDKMAPPERNVLVGNTRLPSAPRVLKELNLTLDTTKSSNSNFFPEEDFLWLLRQRVTVLYRHTVLRLECRDTNQDNDDDDDNNNQKKKGPLWYALVHKREYVSNPHNYHYYLDRQREPMVATTTMGPFDFVVVANGVCSSLVSSSSSFLSSSLALVGDARWVPDQWWDLGTKRLQSGADTAIQDGLELANLLAHHHQQQQQQQQQNSPSLLPDNQERLLSLGRFCAVRKSRQRARRRQAVLGMCLTIVCLLLAHQLAVHKNINGVVYKSR